MLSHRRGAGMAPKHRRVDSRTRLCGDGCDGISEESTLSLREQVLRAEVRPQLPNARSKPQLPACVPQSLQEPSCSEVV